MTIPPPEPAAAPRREIVAWAMYDFANSAFYTSIVAVIFQLHFSFTLVPGGEATLMGRTLKGESLWGYATSAAFLLVFLAAPVIGAMCDFSGRKKRLTALFCAVAMPATAALAVPEPGQYLQSIPMLVIALFGFQASVALSNAFLPELTTPAKTNRVSGFAWAMGYVGGALCLALNLWMIEDGAPEERLARTRMTFLVVAVWWALFSLPFFLFVKERARPRPPPAGSFVAAGFRQALTTLVSLRQNRELYKFLFAFVLINAGLITVLNQAANFGKRNLGMDDVGLVKMILMVQLVAAPGALAFGPAADRWGTKRTLYALLAAWTGICLGVYFVRGAMEFWIIAAAVALVMGGTQSVCRAAVAKLSPPDRVGEYYGFFAMATMLAEVFGSMVYPTVSEMLGDPRAGILSVAVMFVAGAAALAPVKEP